MKGKICVLILTLLMSLLFVFPAQAEQTLDYVTDAAGILTWEEAQELEQTAKEVSERFDFGVYIITVEDYRDYTYGDAFDAIEEIYDQYDLGMGADRDGVVLFLSMAQRDFCLYAHGDYGNYVFTDEGREAMTEYFLDDFKWDNWYNGFADYLSQSADYLEKAEAGSPYSSENLPMESGDRFWEIVIRIGIILLLPLLIAAIVIGVLKAKMKSVAAATQASAYMVGGLQLTDSMDRFTHATESRVKIESNSGSGTRHSGSGSGTVGKF